MTTPPPELGANLQRDPKALAAQLQSSRAAAGAEELEASLFSQVLEKMEKSLSITDEESSDAGHESWAAIGVQALSRGLAHGHLLGIATMVDHALGVHSNGAATDAGSSAGMGDAQTNPAPALNPFKSKALPPIETKEDQGNRR
jgi:hypothetical protein